MNNPFLTRTTDAYKLYHDQVFIREIDHGKDIDKPGFEHDLGFVSELNLRQEISQHLAGWIKTYLPSLNDIRDTHLKSCKRESLKSNPDKMAKYQDKFETITKLYYCSDMLKTIPCTAAYDLEACNYLMALKYQCQGLVLGQKHTSPSSHLSPTDKKSRWETLQNNPVYLYLLNATKETSYQENNLNSLFNTPINELTDKLFERIVTLQYESSNKVTTSQQYHYFDGISNRDWCYFHKNYDNVTNSAEALTLAEQNFKTWINNNFTEQKLEQSNVRSL